MSTITKEKLESLGFNREGKTKALLELESDCVKEINKTLEDYDFIVEFRHDEILYFSLYGINNDSIEIEDVTIIVTSFDHLKELIKPETIKTVFDLMYLGVKHK